MRVDRYELLGALQTVSYLAGACDSSARKVDSDEARRCLSLVRDTLKNLADDIRSMFDSEEEDADAYREGEES